jgi:hypothetical protein
MPYTHLPKEQRLKEAKEFLRDSRAGYLRGYLEDCLEDIKNALLHEKNSSVVSELQGRAQEVNNLLRVLFNHAD